MKTKIVQEFIQAINTADVSELNDLMSEDHLFIDAHDNRVKGRDAMLEGWKGYFSMFPDYKIEITEIAEFDSFICVLGYAGGTYKNIKNSENTNYWRVPAAWKVIVENDKVKHWQVYADNSFALDIIKRIEGKPWTFE